MPHTTGPAIVCAIRTRPRSRIPVANSQWTNSARGSTVLLEVGQERPRDREREEDPRRCNEQRWLDGEPPEPLMVRVQQGQPPRLDDRPDDPADDGQRPEEPDRADAGASVADGRRQRPCELRFHLSP